MPRGVRPASESGVCWLEDWSVRQAGRGLRQTGEEASTSDSGFDLDSGGPGRYRPATRPKNSPFGLVESFLVFHPGGAGIGEPTRASQRRAGCRSGREAGPSVRLTG